jgi:hypothetical protein
LAGALPATGEHGEIVMMCTIVVATLLAATLIAPSAFAQASYQHHRYCLRTATGFECAFNTMAECREAAAATSGTCMRNTRSADADSASSFAALVASVRAGA